MASIELVLSVIVRIVVQGVFFSVDESSSCRVKDRLGPRFRAS